MHLPPMSEEGAPDATSAVHVSAALLGDRRVRRVFGVP